MKHNSFINYNYNKFIEYLRLTEDTLSISISYTIIEYFIRVLCVLIRMVKLL